MSSAILERARLATDSFRQRLGEYSTATAFGLGYVLLFVAWAMFFVFAVMFFGAILLLKPALIAFVAWCVWAVVSAVFELPSFPYVTVFGLTLLFMFINQLSKKD